ncbi:MAG: PilZ domain-containing protein [Deltaproteobacteria bacterium]|nr:PilZ domain-containing protein [Deltaproteobacteria bacterium]
MGIRREQWSRLEVEVKLETPRKTHRFHSLHVSPGGLFIQTEISLDRGTSVTASFTVEDQPVVAHAEVWRILSADQAADRGIVAGGAGLEMRIVRMEGDGSQILADHIKKILLESGGPG